MLDTPEFSILQYNVNKSDKKVMTPLFQDLDSKKNHVIAIQEPWINPITKDKSHDDPQYHQIFPKGSNPRVCFYISKNIDPRVCFYISKNIDPTSWECTEHHPSLMTLIVETSDGPMQIHNCYHPPAEHNSTR
jgi:hypothetical protein